MIVRVSLRSASSPEPVSADSLVAAFMFPVSLPEPVSGRVRVIVLSLSRAEPVSVSDLRTLLDQYVPLKYVGLK